MTSGRPLAVITSKDIWLLAFMEAQAPARHRRVIILADIARFLLEINGLNKQRILRRQLEFGLAVECELFEVFVWAKSGLTEINRVERITRIPKIPELRA